MEELVKASIHLIRLKFRLGADPEFYRAVALGERWLPDGGWMRLTAYQRRPETTDEEYLLEGLLLLLELGKPDDALLEAHRLLSPSQKIRARGTVQEWRNRPKTCPLIVRRWLASERHQRN